MKKFKMPHGPAYHYEFCTKTCTDCTRCKHRAACTMPIDGATIPPEQGMMALLYSTVGKTFGGINYLLSRREALAYVMNYPVWAGRRPPFAKASITQMPQTSSSVVQQAL